MELKKEDFEGIIKWFMRCGNYKMLEAMLSKIYHFSDVDSFVAEHEDSYTILGNGVIETDELADMLKLKSFKELENSFIYIRNENEFEQFKQSLYLEAENKKLAMEESQKNSDFLLKETIKKYVSDENLQKEIFQIVKDSEKLQGEELLCQMDKVYKITKSQQNLTEIFMTNPNLKVDKNTYVIKNRKEKGVI